MRERLFFAGLSRQGASEQGEGGDVGIGECDDIEREAHGGCVLSGEGFFSLVPAFVLSELSEAFAIGFRIFLPFLVVDLIIAHLLLALGMSMLNPITVSLPFKLLLLVLSDGWFLLCQGLVEGYR